MTNIVGFAWESALFALRNHTMQPRKEMTLMQPKLPQDERYEQRPDGTIRRFRQQTPPAQSTYIPQPPPDEPPRTRYQVPLLTVRSQFFSCDLVPPPRRLI